MSKIILAQRQSWITYAGQTVYKAFYNCSAHKIELACTDNQSVTNWCMGTCCYIYIYIYLWMYHVDLLTLHTPMSVYCVLLWINLTNDELGQPMQIALIGQNLIPSFNALEWNVFLCKSTSSETDGPKCRQLKSTIVNNVHSYPLLTP